MPASLLSVCRRRRRRRRFLRPHDCSPLPAALAFPATLLIEQLLQQWTGSPSRWPLCPLLAGAGCTSALAWATSCTFWISMPAARRNRQRQLCSGERAEDQCFCPALTTGLLPCPSEPCTSLGSRSTLLQGRPDRWPAPNCIRLAGYVPTAAPGGPGPPVTRGLEPDDAVQPHSERHPGGRRRQVGGRQVPGRVSGGACCRQLRAAMRTLRHHGELVAICIAICIVLVR